MSSGYSITTVSFTPAHSGEISGSTWGAPYSGREKRSRASVKNLSNEQILLNSLYYAEKKSKETVAGKLRSALPSLFFIAVPAALGAMQKGPLSTKVASALTTAVLFAGMDAVCNVYDKGMERVSGASEKLEKLREEHPVAAMAGDFAGKALLIAGGLVALSKGGRYLQNKFQPSAKALSDSFAMAAKKIDSTKLAKKVAKAGKHFDNFKLNHPKFANFINKNAFLSPLAVLLGWIGLKGAVAVKDENNKAEFAAKRMEDLILLRHDAGLYL